MSIRNFMLLTAFATSTTFLTSCEPTVMQEPDCLIYAACTGCTQWVGEQVYDYVFKVQDDKAKAEHPDEMGDLVSEPGDDWWNLSVFKGEEDINEETINGNDLDALLTSGSKPSSDNYPYMTAKLVHSQTYTPIQYLFYNPDGDETYEDSNGNYVVISYRLIKDRAIKFAYDMCDGNFEPLKEKICEKVKVYDYRKDEKASSKKTTVYDVVYLVNEKHYVRCSVADLDDKHFEIKYVSDSDLYSDLGY